jgi:hypothetical protein
MLRLLWYLLVGWSSEATEPAPETCGTGWHEWSVWSFPAVSKWVDPRTKQELLTRKQARACVECGEVEIRTVEDWCSEGVMKELRKKMGKVAMDVDAAEAIARIIDDVRSNQAARPAGPTRGEE